eukprot:175526_1
MHHSTGTEQVDFGCKFRADDCDFSWKYPTNITKYMDSQTWNIVQSKISSCKPSTFDSKESKKLSGKIRLLVLGLFMLPIISALYYLFNSWGVSGPSPTVIFVIAMVFEVVLLIINVCFCRKKAKMDYEYRQVLYNNLHIIMKELNKLSENQLIFNLYIKKIESGPKIGLCICLSFFLGAVCGVGCMFATWNEG